MTNEFPGLKDAFSGEMQRIGFFSQGHRELNQFASVVAGDVWKDYRPNPEHLPADQLGVFLVQHSDELSATERVALERYLIEIRGY